MPRHATDRLSRPSVGPGFGHHGPVSTHSGGGYQLRADPVRLATQHRFARTAAVVLLASTGWIAVCAVVAAWAVEPPLWIGFTVCALLLGGTELRRSGPAGRPGGLLPPTR